MTRSRFAAPVLPALALGLLLLPLAVRAGDWEAIERIPGASPVTVMVDDKPRLYFRVPADQPLALSVDGPIRLRLTSRVDFAGGKAGLVSYTLRVLEGARELERQETETALSTRVRGVSDNRDLGKSRRMTVDVPAGRHDLKIAVAGVGAVLVRLHQAAPRRGEEATVSLAPIDAVRGVLVVEGEKTIPYSSVVIGKPVRFRVAGPTSLELITRLDFGAQMRGTQSYRLAVTENGRRLREVEFRTTKATTATYTNLKDFVPSKFDRLVIPVGEGTHEILVGLVGPAGRTAEVHARIPQPSAGAGE